MLTSQGLRAEGFLSDFNERKVIFLKHHDFTFVMSNPRTVVASAGTTDFYKSHGKRAFDIVLALLLLPIVAPVVLVIWGIIKASGGSGCFAQERVGLNGKIFKCWKLRTMEEGAAAKLDLLLETDSEAAAEWERSQKLRQDVRITKLGRVLRKTCLDELPQLWNVLRGEMSFVGPRPVVPSELLRYGVHRRSYLAVRPGITGLWQVSGRNSVSYARRVALDVTYQRRFSAVVDFKILFLTLFVFFDGNGS